MNGGNYGSTGGRQQRKRPRDNDDEQYRRPRPVSSHLDKLRRDLVNLADPGPVDALADIKYVARKLASESPTPETLGLLRECVLQFSIKTSQYAALVALAASQNHDFGKHFVESLATSINQAFVDHAWRDAKLLLRLLAAIDPRVNQTSTTALSIVTGLAEQISSLGLVKRDDFADRICTLVLITLPYISVAQAKTEGEFDSNFSPILDHIGPYIKARKSSSEDFFSWSHSEENKDILKHECLDTLYEQSKSMSATSHRVPILPSIVLDLGLESDSHLFEVPAISLPERRDSSPAYARLEFFFQIFNDESIITVPSIDNLASSILRDAVVDVLDLFVANRKDSARFLIDMESYLAPNLFVLRGTPPEKVPSGSSSWKAEDIVVEVIFGQLFALPVSSQKAVYYHSVLTELCKLVPQAIAPTFGRAIRALYSKLPSLEAEVVSRFWDWFSHHLSNFGFNWKWQLWIPDLDLHAMHPKRVFIQEAIWKEAELSYNDRIKTTLPVEYHHIIPDKASGPDFAYGAPDHPLAEQASGLLSLLSSEHTPEQISAAIDAIEKKASEVGRDPESESVVLLCQCVLQQGHQSFSHALNTIEHNLPVLQAKCNRSTMTRRSTVAAVMQLWSGRPLVASTLLQKFLNYRLISPVSVLEYILLDSAPSTLATSATWELLRTTIDKVSARVVQVQDRLLQIASPGEANGEDKSSDEETERMQATLSEVQQEQKDVFAFTLKTFSDKLAALPADNENDVWIKYWMGGLFRMVLRRYKEQLTSLRADILSQYPEVEQWLK